MFGCNVWGTIEVQYCCTSCAWHRDIERAHVRKYLIVWHTPKCSLPSLSLLSPLLLLHNVFVFGDNNALILHCCNPVKKTAKILAQIRKAVALIKAAASSCYAHSHKLKKRKHPAFSQFFSAQIGKKKNAMIIFTQPREGRGVVCQSTTFLLVKICFNSCIIINQSQMLPRKKSQNSWPLGGGSTLMVSLTVKKTFFLQLS